MGRHCQDAEHACSGGAEQAGRPKGQRLWAIIKGHGGGSAIGVPLNKVTLLDAYRSLGSRHFFVRPGKQRCAAPGRAGRQWGAGGFTARCQAMLPAGFGKVTQAALVLDFQKRVLGFSGLQLFNSSHRRLLCGAQMQLWPNSFSTL